MLKFWIITIAILAVFTAILGKLSFGHYRRMNSDKMWKEQGMRTRYWQGVVIMSFGLTVLTIFLLRWANVLMFE